MIISAHYFVQAECNLNIEGKLKVAEQSARGLATCGQDSSNLRSATICYNLFIEKLSLTISTYCLQQFVASRNLVTACFRVESYELFNCFLNDMAGHAGDSLYENLVASVLQDLHDFREGEPVWHRLATSQCIAEFGS